LNLAWATAITIAIVLGSVTIGYEAGWFNPSRPVPVGPSLAGPQDCNGTPVDLSFGVDSADSGVLASGWSQLGAAFSNATGGCVRTTESSNSSEFDALAAHQVDSVVGPQLPSLDDPPNVQGSTFDLPLFEAPLDILYNAPGLTGPLNLTAAALAGAYLGLVRSWSDPTLTEWNPGLDSRLNLSVVYLQGPSESNLLFTTYLAQYNASFARELGAAGSVNWPVGQPADSLAQMVERVENTPGSIGYAPAFDCPASPTSIGCARVATGDATFLAPTGSAVLRAANLLANSTAARTGDWQNLTGVAPTGSAGYPMIQFTYAIVFRDLGVSYGPALGVEPAKWLVTMLWWVAADSGALSAPSGSSALPAGLASIAEETLQKVTYDGASILGGGEEGGENGDQTGEF
jgi:phosphate transport system substrate-binding protein